MILKWRKPLSSLKRKRQTVARPPILGVEQLEDRCLLSVTGFRPIDEVGNNVANPTWGAAPADQSNGAAVQLLRLSPVAYADGISTPSLPYGGGGIGNSPPMPSPRTISNDVFNQSPTLFGSPSTDITTVDGNGLSDFGYSFGQFIDHDMDLTPDNGTENTGPGDFPIPPDNTNSGDPIGSLAFGRSVYDPTTGTGLGNPRQQVNVVTSYLDLSQVYGSSQEVADALRTFSGGQLKTSPGKMLPFNNLNYFTQDQLNALAMQNSGPLPDGELYAAGDARANENTELVALTTLFVRNHNFIAQELHRENPTWTDEQLYQEARKINIAEYQNIVYTQYLPALLGPSAPAYTGYNPTVSASIATEFSTIAFRFGHSMLNNNVERDANNGSSLGAVPLAEDFFDPNLVNADGAIDPITGLAATDIGAYLKGDAESSSQAVDTLVVSSVRDDLFGNGIPGGEDLISRDIWRARDDGIGTYNQVRVALGLPAITNDATHGFDQITSNVTVQHELEQAYASTIAAGGFAGDIDPFVGGLAEDHVPGSDMGPLFTAILAKQFSALENGDRYFYLNETWTPQETAILQQGRTLAQIITTNTGVTNLQANVFYYQSEFTVGSTLYLNGGNQTNDTVQISPIGRSNTGSTGVQVNARLNGDRLTNALTQAFNSIVFFGGGGNDTIKVASSLTIPVSITAGDGKDNVLLGSGNNTVTLGNGNDIVTAGTPWSTGNDRIQLGNGNYDSVTLMGNGSDQVQLGNGNHDFVALIGNGNDNIQIGNGINDYVTLMGDGNDYVGTGTGSGVVFVRGRGHKTVHLGSHGWIQI